MAVRPYLCPITEEIRYEAYVNLRSRQDQSIRIQKYKKCETEVLAIRAEKKLLRFAAETIAEKEARGNCWGRLISLWEHETTKYGKNPVTGNDLTTKTINNATSMLVNWTESWLPTPAKELNRSHGRQLIMRAEDAELKVSSIRKLKNTVNTVHMFGVQEGIIQGVHNSPVYGINLNEASDSLPEILTVEEVSRLLYEARRRNHPWYRIWAVALMTGMRSSELYALRKDNVHLKEGLIRIAESWDWEINEPKSTKAGYWRKGPIAGSLRPIVEEALDTDPNNPYLLPRFEEWRKGQQAMVLRNFCDQIGISSVKFHTLRACFATHLLASGVDSVTVMRIGGWRDMKTFQIYVRLAGVNEKGATEGLGKIYLPSEEAAFNHISDAYSQGAA